MRNSKVLLCILMLIIGLMSSSCPFLFNQNDGDLSYEVLWRAPMSAAYNSSPSVLDENVLYIRQDDEGIIAINTRDGTEVWRNIEATAARPTSDLLLIDDWILFSGYTGATKDKKPDDIYLMNRHTGSLVGWNSWHCPDFEKVEWWDMVYTDLNWRASYNNTVFLPLQHLTSTGTFAYRGVYSFEFSAEQFTPDGSAAPLDLNCVYRFNGRQHAMPPLIVDNIMYLYIGGIGWRGVLPDGVEFVEGYYLQEDVCLVALDLDTKQELWNRPLQYCGSSGFKNNLILEEGVIYIADGRGLAAVRASNGELIYDKPYPTGIYTSGYPVYHDGILYLPASSRNGPMISAFYATTGTLKWTHTVTNTSLVSRESNPIVYGDRVYIVDQEGLRTYNKNTGQYYGKQDSLGIYGARMPGYMPYTDNIMYIPQTEMLLAVRLGSEK